MKKYNLVSPNWDNKEIEAINKVVKSGYFTIGKNVEKFEKQFSKKQGMKYSVMVNSGSSANLIAIYSLFFIKKNPLKRGDEVIVPALSWSTTYSPLEQLGLRVRIIDINMDTLNIDLNLLKKNISSKTKLIIGVSILGNPADLYEIRKICIKKKIHFMEDNCESLGASLKNKNTGTFGLINTNSFFFSHHINTIEGGMVSTNNEEVYHNLLCLREHGWTRRLPNSKFYKKSKNFEDYNFVLPGFNVRPTEINAAIGLIQLKKLDNFVRIRRKNFKLFQKLFSNNEFFHIQKENGMSSSFAFTFVLKKKYSHLRQRILNKLRKNKIEFRLITGGSINLHPYIRKFNYSKTSLKVSEYVHKYGFFTGNHPVDLSKEINYLKEVLKEL